MGWLKLRELKLTISLNRILDLIRDFRARPVPVPVPVPVPQLPGENKMGVAIAVLKFKHEADRTKFNQLDFRVRLVVGMARVWAVSRGHEEITVTDIDTPGIHMKNGPHYRQRAVDLRIGPLSVKEWEEFGAWVDRFLDYGRGYRCVLVGYLDPQGRHNDHVHIQVPYPYIVDGTVPLYKASDQLVTLPARG